MRAAARPGIRRNPTVAPPARGSNTTGVGGLPYSFTLPTNVAGNMLVVGINNDRGLDLVTPAGWTKINTAHQSYCDVQVFTKISTGDTVFLAQDPANPAGNPSGATVNGVAVAYSGVSTISANATSVGTGGASVYSFPTVPVQSLDRVVHAVCAQSSGGVGLFSMGPNMNLIAQITAGTTSFELGDWVPGITGTEPGQSSSPNVADNWAGVTIAMRP